MRAWSGLTWSQRASDSGAGCASSGVAWRASVYLCVDTLACWWRSCARSEAAFDVAAAEVKAHLDNGTPLAELMASCGLDPGPAAPAPPPPSPPSPAAPAAVRDQEVPESLVGLAAYLLWEEAGNPDGADFGVQAKALLQEALRSGVALGEVEGRMRDASRGPTAAARLGLKDVPANFR